MRCTECKLWKHELLCLLLQLFFRIIKNVYFHDEVDGDRDDIVLAIGFGALPLKTILGSTVSRRIGRGVMIRKME